MFNIKLTLVFLAFALVLFSGCSVNSGTIIECGGLAVAEIESVALADGWQAETDMDGFSGENYYTWRGERLLKTPGSGLMVYKIHINTSGKYHFRIRNRHDHPDNTEENDVWVKMDDGKWVKTFSSIRGKWNWHTRFDYSHESRPWCSFELTDGEHTLSLSGRSPGFSLDKFCLYADGVENPAEQEAAAGKK